MGLAGFSLSRSSHMQSCVQIAGRNQLGSHYSVVATDPAADQAVVGMSCDGCGENHPTCVMPKVPPFRKLPMA